MDGTWVETAYSASSNDMYGKKNRTLWHASVDLREQLDLKVHNNDLISYFSVIVHSPSKCLVQVAFL